jgi:CheY-like chemotaxis protein
MNLLGNGGAGPGLTIATRLIRQREQSTGGRLPFVALTARSRKEDRARCLSCGSGELTRRVSARPG